MREKYRPFKKSNNLLSKVGISDYFSLHSKEINNTVKYRRILNNPILEKLAIDHSKKEERKKDSKSTIVLVHPFYFMHDKKYLTKKTRKDFEEYTKKLDFVLDNSYKDFSLVLYDSYLSYIARTGKLAEKGYFDKILFSNQDSGEPINKHELNYFNKKIVYVAGLYNGDCLSRAITEIKENSVSRKVKAIKDLILEPIFFENKSLKSKKIYDRWGKKVKSVRINDLIDILEE